MPKSKAALPRLNGESDCIKKFQFFQISDSQMKQSLMLEVFCDHLSGLSVTSSAGNSLKTLHPDSFSTGHNTKAITKSLFHINDLSSTSITVSWNLSDEITRMRMLASHGTNLGQSALSVSNPIRHSAKDVKLAIVLSVTSHVCTSSITDSRVGEFDTEKWVHQTTDVTGIFCIDGLLPDTKYAVNMTIRWNTNIPTVVTAASTTLAGISSPVAQSLPGSLAARLMRSSGVASSGISSGDVSPTLSGTSVADMKDPTSGKLAKEEIDAVKMTLHVVSRTNISSNEGKIDSDNLIGDSEMDGALQTTAFSLNNSRNSSKSIRSPHSSESTALMASGDTASYSSESVLQLTAADIDAFVSGVPTISSVSLVVATDTEQLFLLDNSTLPSSLLLGQNALTVKNKTNKKWSTARATISLTSGIHRWGVHIDRCISKNIFIGVVTEDARSDNYVGCDRFGWAFLANRAVWHNKSKIRSYGELFVTGDMIVVTLNLDLGTMTFTLNGKDLGIAVEGLSGSFFPAFSLYNEDDQITLIPIKGTHLPLSSYYSQKNGPEFKSTISAGGNVIDRKSNGNAVSHTIAGLFDRIEVLSSLLGSISSNPGPDAVSFEMSSELYVRWMRWMRGGVTRTICSSAGYFVTISLSDSDIFNFFPPFSDIFFSAGETVKWANNYAIVLGVGSHRLWFQSLESGNVSGLTRETLAQLQARHIIRPIDLNQKAVAEKIIQITEQSAPLPAENYTAFADFSSAINCQHKYWDHDLDTALVRWIELIARKLGVHVCNLTFHSISSPAAAVSKAYSHEFSAVLHSFYKLFAPLSKIPLINIRLRALFLISANDMLVPLLPLLPKPENENAFEHSSWFLASDIAELLTKSKHVLFRQVKLEFASRQGSDFQPSAQYANVLPRSGSKRNLLSGPVGGKTQIYGESSANFCSAHYQLSPTPYVMPVASYFSNSSEPYYSNIVNSGVNTVARIASDNIDADTSAVVLTETVKSISAAKTSSMRLEAAMEELQLQQGFQSQQILFGAATTVGDTHDTGVSGLNVCISNVSKKNRSPRGIGAASGADGRVTGIPTLELEASHAFAHSLFENAVAVGSELVLISDPR